jgi:hypothetical protein
MNADRYVAVYFCDDVRSEMGNKFSLMGCYSGELLVEAFPVALPKFCAEVRLVTPIARPFEKAIVRAFLNDDLIGEIELPVQDAKKTMPVADEFNTRMTMRAIMSFAPFLIEREGALRIEAETEEGILKGGQLRLMLQETFRQRQAKMNEIQPT